MSAYPKFDQFCRFITAAERAFNGAKPSAMKHPHQRWKQALVEAELGELAPAELVQLNTHMAEAYRTLDYLVEQLREVQLRHGISENVTLAELFDRVPESDLGRATMTYDVESFVADGIEAWRRLGRKGEPTVAFGSNVPPDERGGILAYALRNGMFD